MPVVVRGPQAFAWPVAERCTWTVGAPKGHADWSPCGAAMAAVGLIDVRWILTAGGIIAIHAGTVEE